MSMHLNDLDHELIDKMIRRQPMPGLSDETRDGLSKTLHRALTELETLRAERVIAVDAAGVLLRVCNTLEHCAEKHGAVGAQQALAEVQHFTSKHGMTQAPSADAAKADMSAEVIRRVVEPMLEDFYQHLNFAVGDDGFVIIISDRRAPLVHCADIVRAALAVTK